jgi:hypothetical protein
MGPSIPDRESTGSYPAGEDIEKAKRDYEQAVEDAENGLSKRQRKRFIKKETDKILKKGIKPKFFTRSNITPAKKKRK